MSSKKIKIVGYITPKEKERIQERARSLGMTIGSYLAEVSMWENRFALLPQLRKGGTIICNGRTKE